MKKTMCFNFIYDQFNNDVALKIKQKHKFSDQDSADQPINRDDNLLYVRRLYEKFTQNGYAVHTSDYYYKSQQPPEIVIFFDISKEKSKVFDPLWKNSKKVLIINECEAICPDNWDLDLHYYFDMIFTWDVDYLNDKKYVYMPVFVGYSYDVIDEFSLGFNNRENILNIICSNKKNNHKYDLYRKRRDIIDWFSKKDSEVFSYYGNGWEYLVLHGGILSSIFNRLRVLAKYFNRVYSTYGGPLDEKKTVLTKTRFSFTLENAVGYKSYLTEKIFDAMQYGAVPVYLGATDITNLIPENCFIDMRKFNDLSDLYYYLINMTEQEYIKIQKNILNFNNSKKSLCYKPAYFSSNIYENILKIV